jgi:NADPH2:quinone reductase
VLAKHPQVAFHVYESVDHAFARNGGEHYDAAAAKLANERTRDFFRKHLGVSEISAAHPPSRGRAEKARAVRFAKTGGPEVLTWDEVALAEPGPGEVLVRHSAVGLNFIDTYHRSGLYPQPMPSGIGLEAAGTVEAVGPGVTALKAGDRVAYGTGPIGAYSEARVMPADKLVKLPDGIDDREGAAMMLKGLTVQYLLRQSYRVQKGDTVLVHAAAGGIGLIAGQWLRHIGVTAIGTAGSKDKVELARQHGYAHVINYRDEDVVEAVKRITKGEMLPAVYDGVGKDTWEMSLNCLRPTGFMISFGNASGPVPPINVGQLAAKGSLYVQRPTLMTYTRTPALLQAMAKELLEVVGSGAVKIRVEQTYALKDAAQAHRDLEGRKTTGQTVLLP